MADLMHPGPEPRADDAVEVGPFDGLPLLQLDDQLARAAGARMLPAHR